MNRLESAFSKAIGVQNVEEVRQLEYGKSKGWDSIVHMQLIALLEEEFDIMIDIQDVVDMSSFEKAIEILSKYGVSV